MANDLKLQVLLNAIDRATRPLRAIQRQSTEAAQALKAARDKLKNLNDTQKQVTGFRELKQGLASTQAALESARQHTQQLGKTLAQTQNPTRAMTREFAQAKRALHQLKQQENAQTMQLQQLRQKLQTTGISTRNLGEHERQLRQDIRAANQQMDIQRRRLESLARQQLRLTRASQTYQRQQQTAGNLAGKGAAMAAGGGGTLYAGTRLMAPGLEFDASMSRVQAITRLDKGDPEKAEQLQGLRDQARALGGSTMFTAGQAADAQGYLGMAGFDPKAIKAAMPGMLDLAAAGGADLAQTADIASNIMSGLGMTADQMDRLGDVLVGTFTRSNTNLQMLGDTMKYAAPMAKTYGVELEVAAAMAGKLGDAGLQGSMGGTALSSIMNRLAAPPKAAQKALEQLNIKTADANGNLRQMPDILKEIYDKTKNLGTAKKGGLFKAIAGEEAVKGMAQLVEQAGIGELQKLIATLRETQGEAAKTSKVMADNLKGDLTTLGSAWQDLGIELQEQQDGPLRGLVQSVIDIVRGVKTWAKENPGLASGLVKTVAIVAGLAMAIGGLLVTVASVLLPFAALRLMFAQLGIRLPSLIGLLWKLGKTVLPFVGKTLLMIGRALMLNPIGLAMTALAGAAYLIYQNWDAVKLYFTSAWAEIKAGFSSGIGGILTTLANFSPIGLIYQAFAGVLSYLGVDLPNRFTEFGNMIVNGLVNGLFAGMGQIKSAITSIGDSTIGWFKEKLDIHSPSRVFAELGGFTMAGLTLGLEGGAKGPLDAITRMGKQLTAAGALALGTASMPALAIDDRPPISSMTAPAYDSHDNYEINIHPTPGMDAHAIARAVRAELTRIEREKGARTRSRLSDLE
ncbi:phage tail tape measure protein [Pseudomonas sp. 18173]|uniref:phage tail tape measure protein n=1 Tax=Pseudomonas sp. 18173 TaxID=3390055 RepID=UPI003D25DB52